MYSTPARYVEDLRNMHLSSQERQQLRNMANPQEANPVTSPVLSDLLVDAMEKRAIVGEADALQAMRTRRLSALSNTVSYFNNSQDGSSRRSSQSDYSYPGRLSYSRSNSNVISPEPQMSQFSNMRASAFSPLPPQRVGLPSGRVETMDGKVVDSKRPIDEFEYMYGKSQRPTVAEPSVPLQRLKTPLLSAISSYMQPTPKPAVNPLFSTGVHTPSQSIKSPGITPTTSFQSVQMPISSYQMRRDSITPTSPIFRSTGNATMRQADQMPMTSLQVRKNSKTPTSPPINSPEATTTSYQSAHSPLSTVQIEKENQAATPYSTPSSTSKKLSINLSSPTYVNGTNLSKAATSIEKAKETPFTTPMAAAVREGSITPTSAAQKLPTPFQTPAQSLPTTVSAETSFEDVKTTPTSASPESQTPFQTPAQSLPATISLETPTEERKRTPQITEAESPRTPVTSNGQSTPLPELITSAETSVNDGKITPQTAEAASPRTPTTPTSELQSPPRGLLLPLSELQSPPYTPLGVSTPSSSELRSTAMSPISSVSSVSLDSFLDVTSPTQKDFSFNIDAEDSFGEHVLQGTSFESHAGSRDHDSADRRHSTLQLEVNNAMNAQPPSFNMQARSFGFRSHGGYAEWKASNSDDSAFQAHQTNGWQNSFQNSPQRKLSKTQRMSLIGSDEGSSVNEGFRRELEESLFSVISSGKNSKKKMFLMGSEGEEVEENKEAAKGDRGYNPILYQKVLKPDNNTNQIDEILMTLQSTKKLHGVAAKKYGPPSNNAFNKKDRRQMRQSLLTDINQELERFQDEESYDAKWRRAGLDEHKPEEDRHSKAMLQGASQFYLTGKMNAELSQAILDTNTDDLAAALTDEDTDYILQNFNFEEMAGQLKKELHAS